MRSQNTVRTTPSPRRAATGWALAAICTGLVITLGAGVTTARAQANGSHATGTAASGSVTLVPTYRPNSQLTYAISIHTEIGDQATMDTKAEAEVHILAGATPGHFDAELRFLSYNTTAHADSPAAQQQLEQQVNGIDQTANSMVPVQVRVSGGKLTVLSRPEGKNYDQPVEMLVQLARTDSLPTGPVQVGDTWTHVRPQPIPTLSVSVPLTLDASLTALTPASKQSGSRPQATITLHSHGQVNLPPDALPESKEMSAQGLVPEASVSFNTTAVSQYQLPDAVLLNTKSQSDNRMKIRFVGPSPDAHASETEIHSTATLQLIKVSSGN